MLDANIWSLRGKTETALARNRSFESVPRSMPNVLITPHVAIYGTPYREKWEAMLIENCRRFAAGQPLLNLVDKEKWF